MERDITWKTWDDNGLEQLHLSQSNTAITAQSLITGIEDNHPFTLHYTIDCDLQWHVQAVSLRTLFGNNQRTLDLQAYDGGHWSTGSGDPLPSLDGCIDIDISATPFTNTLPIRRLGLKPGQSAEILVVYISVPDLQFQPAQQRYTCLESGSNGGLYRYESLASGYTAELEVDGEGIVVDYPDLFRRV